MRPVRSRRRPCCPQRADEPTTYRHSEELRLEGFPNADHKCEAQLPGSGAAYCLTRMMDCRKPSGAFKDNIKANLMVPGRRLVQTWCVDLRAPSAPPSATHSLASLPRLLRLQYGGRILAHRCPMRL